MDKTNRQNIRRSRDELVDHETVHLLYSHARNANISTLLAAAVLVFVQWQVISHTILVGWLGFITAVSLYRIAQSYWYHRDPQQINRTQYWKKGYILSTGFSALGWGSSGLLLFSYDSLAHQTFLIYVLAGIAAGGVATLSMVRLVYTLHLLLVLLPTTFHFYFLADKLHFAIGVLATVYLFLLLRIAGSMHDTLRDSLNLRFENVDLVSILSEAKQKAEELNEELKIEINERKKGEQTLRESEEKYRMLIEIMPQAIVIIQGRKPVFANKLALEIFGFSETDDISEIDIMNLVRESERDRLGHYILERISGRDDAPDHYYATLKTSIGTRFPAELYARKIIYSGRSAVQLIISDMSERKKMEEEILKVRKLESIGVFAGGIAHDFNNLLTGILGNITLAKISTPKEDTNAQWLEEAHEACCRAKGLTQQLLTFSKGGLPVKKAASLNELIVNSALFVLRGSNVKCEFDIAPDLWPVEVDEGQFVQVINNLVINGDQAMPEGGIIRIRAENSVVLSGSGLSLVKGDYVRIAVQDEGIGIHEKYQSKVFDPYFSTKEKGSGLGLAISYSIVQNHGGCIILDSEVGLGTRFFIYLPALPDGKIQEGVKERAERKKPLTSGHILVVDDEEMIRKVVGNILVHLGFDPVFAADGDEAITLYQKAAISNRRFQMVILDLTIPGGKGGRETIKELLEIDPKAKVVVASGYSNDPIMADYGSYGFSAVLTKPFDIDEIRLVIEDVLGDTDTD